MEKRRMRTSRIVLQIVSISFSILLLLLATIGVYQVGKKAYNFGYRIFTEKAVDEPPGTDILLRVKKGMSTYELAERMEQKKLIKSAKVFFIQAKIRANAKKIQPGTYTLNTSMNAEEILDILTQEDEKEKKKTVSSTDKR